MRNCEGCGKPLEEGRSPLRRFHDGTCRSRAHRRGATVTPIVADAAEPRRPLSNVQAVERRLAELGDAGSPLGVSALTLAAHLDNPGSDTGSSLAAVQKRMVETLQTLEAKAPRSQTRLDELRERRERRAAGE